ncbi:MAG TPA: YjbE family putative metal transport protein [Rhizomicrobium sp.]|nr:YjbE family putative metal transport protein [Rhizomicrobium sp.]
MHGFHLIPPALAALIQVILIDIAMAGDNAIVIGLAAARVPKPDRRKVIFGGLAAAVVMRLVLATLTATILARIGLMFAGGILLLWVAWRLYRDIHHSNADKIGAHALAVAHEKLPVSIDGAHPAAPCASTPVECLTTSVRPPALTPDVRRAIIQIAIADVSMSLDNVLAVAGAAMNHVWVLVVGLILSIALMGFAASLMARLLQRHPWISYAGLTIVVYVALRMIWFGGMEIWHAV